MIRLKCFGDTQLWGKGLVAAASKRKGFKASLFDQVHEVQRGDVVFFHMHHHPEVRDRHKRMMEELYAKGAKLIPDIGQARLYDDKVAQARAYSKWMPETVVLTSPNDAHIVLRNAVYPFISKASEGASSHNVRLIKSEAEALQEVEQVFAAGPGIKLRYAKRQRGYLLWQRFIPDNPFDVRVIAIGKERLILKRFNRDDRPMASGSGKLEAVTSLTDGFIRSALHFADSFFEAEGTKWCGIDLVYDHVLSKWRLLESTVGWTLTGYFDCKFFPDGRKGYDVWEVTLDELERGNLV